MVFFVAEKRAEKERKKGCEIIIYDVLINENERIINPHDIPISHSSDIQRLDALMNRHTVKASCTQITHVVTGSIKNEEVVYFRILLLTNGLIIRILGFVPDGQNIPMVQLLFC